MRIRIGDGLFIVVLLVTLLIIAITFPSPNVLRVTLGLPFVLFFPGYTLLLAVSPRRHSIRIAKRLALSFGLSMVVVSIIGLILNYFPWGIRLEPLLYSLTFFIFFTSTIAWFRRSRLPEEELLNIEFQPKIPGLGKSRLDKALSIALILATLGAFGVVAYVAAAPKAGSNFTEFGILGPEGTLENYSRQFVVGQEGKLILSITNSENETIIYRVEVTVNGTANNEIKGILLEQGGKWEQQVSFVPKQAGKNQKVEFTLYKNGEIEPHLTPLSLWINVGER